MIIEEGQSEIELPEPIEGGYSHFGVYSAGDPEQNPHSYLFHVVLVPPLEILTMSEESKNLRGIPRIYAIIGGDKLMMWPASDRKTVGRLEYMPAPKVI